MPTIHNLPVSTAVTDDDRFVGDDGTTSSTWLAPNVRSYMVANVATQITALQAVDATQTTNIATNTSGLATLNSTVTTLAMSTTNPQTASYTFVLSDGAIPFVTVAMNVATANFLTIPPNSSVPFPIGTVLSAEQWGAGTTTWQGGPGVVIRSRGNLYAMAGPWAASAARKIGTNEWLAFGDLA